MFVIENEGKTFCDFSSFSYVKPIFLLQFTSILYGGHPKIVIPDYKKYVVDQNTPELLKVQERLAAKGLKDPWLRNEVWRYDMREHLVDYGERIRWTLARGVLSGAIIGGVLALLYPIYYRRVLISKGRDPDHAHHCECHYYLNYPLVLAIIQYIVNSSSVEITEFTVHSKSLTKIS